VHASPQHVQTLLCWWHTHTHTKHLNVTWPACACNHQVRALREELLSSRREQALSEAREAELRREAAAAQRALEGISPEEHRAAARDLADTRTRLKRCELELQAALDKLDVYRRADAGGMRSTSAWVAVHTSGIRSAECGAMSQDAMLEHCEGKSQAELCADLLHLQQAMVLQANELDKVRCGDVTQWFCGQSCTASACLHL
jgi:hypothetical protein